MKTVNVLDCSVLKCAYNISNKCHTPAITVGSMCPRCESYMKGSAKGGDPGVNGMVGSCHESSCKFNESLECGAPGIHIGEHMWHADCKTFAKR
jgi:hypothetical protein